MPLMPSLYVSICSLMSSALLQNIYRSCSWDHTQPRGKKPLLLNTQVTIVNYIIYHNINSLVLRLGQGCLGRQNIWAVCRYLRRNLSYLKGVIIKGSLFGKSLEDHMASSEKGKKSFLCSTAFACKLPRCYFERENMN